MSTPRVFQAESVGRTMIVVPVENSGSVGEEHLNAELNGLLEQIEQPQFSHVVFDFQKVSYFGSSMLAVMHALWKRVRAGNGRMAICNVSDVGREVLEISKFDTLWPVYASRKEALEAVAKLSG